MVKKQPTETELLKEINKLIKENPAIAHSFIRLQRALVSIFSTSNIKKLLLELLTKLDSPLDIQELTKNQSNKTRQYNRKTDWSKSSDNSLRAVYKYRIDHDKVIDDELNQELAKRFPTYDPANKIFTYKRETDWSKSSDSCLRNIFFKRKQAGLAIEDELNEALAERFSSYNPKAQEFQGRRHRDWSKASDKELRNAYRVRKRSEKGIEDELNTELSNRFYSYDPEKQCFTNKRKTDWSKSSDMCLRITFIRRQKDNKAIENELNEELAKRFQTYDPIKREFVKKSDSTLALNKETHKTTLTTEATKEESKAKTETDKQKKRKITTDWSKSSDNSLRVAFARRQKSNRPIEDDLNEELAKRFKTYDPVNKTFPGKEPRDWTKASADELRNAVKSRKRSKKTIEDDLNAELAKRFPTYSAEKRAFIGRMPRRVKRPTISSVVYKKAPVLQIVPEQKPVPEQKTEENNTKTKIKITTKFVKYDLDGNTTYNDVYINGKRVLKNHINTEIKLFFDDTLLAIHGIVTDNKNYPLSPVWLLYDTNLKKLIPENKQTFNNYFSVARNIFIMPDGKTLRADLDFRNTSYLYTKEKLKRIANGKYFSYEK